MGSLTRRGSLTLIEHLEGRRLFSATMQGVLWTDLNANGTWDGGDGRAAGWTVYLDQNGNGQLDAGEATTLTNSFGLYTFLGLAAGPYTIRYVVPDPSWHATLGQPDHLTVSVADGQALSGEDMGVTQAGGQISGTVTTDGAPAAQWGVYFDANNNGKVDPGERWTGTDDAGHFLFPDLLAGTYVVRVDPEYRGFSPVAAGGDVVTVQSDGRTPSPPLSFSYKQDPPPARYQVSQLVDYQLIGGSSSDPSTREVNRAAFQNGWTGFVNQTIQPDLNWGARRVELHNPFGILPTDQVYPCDEYLQAQAAGLNWLTKDFVRAWKPMTNSGVEVIGYIGNPETDPSFQGLTANPAAWNQRFNACVAPFLNAHMSIGFDEGQRVQQGDLFAQALDRLTSQGVKVYLEARPPENSYNLQFRVISDNSSWPSDPYADPTAWWAAKNSQLPAGSVVRLITSPPAGVSWSDRQWLLSTVQTIMREGDCAGIAIGVLRAAGLMLNTVLTPVGSAMATAVAAPSTLQTAALSGALDATTIASALNGLAASGNRDTSYVG